MGIANIINNSTTTSGGEIIRELVNASDGQGLNLANQGNISLANSAAAEFGTADFSIEFVLNQTGDNTNDNGIYYSHESGNSRVYFFNDISEDALKIAFIDSSGSSTVKTINYDMSADYNTPTHYVLTFDRDGDATLYKNGNSVGSVDISAFASIDIGSSNSAAGLISTSANGYGVIGTFYRFRTWNKLLSNAEVQTAFERADVDFIDQYGSQTELVTNGDFASATGWSVQSVAIGSNVSTWTDDGSTLQFIRQNAWTITKGKKYRLQFTVSSFSGAGSIGVFDYARANRIADNISVSGNGTVTAEFTAQNSSSSGALLGTADAANNIAAVIDDLSCVQIGCVSDYDLAFANPTQSLTVQDRSGAADGTASSSTAVTQVQPIIQGNMRSLAVTTTSQAAGVPEDGAIMADKIGVGAAPSAYQLDVVTTGNNGIRTDNGTAQIYLGTISGNASVGTLTNHTFNLIANGGSKVAIDSTGATAITKTISSSSANEELLAVKADHAGATTNNSFGGYLAFYHRTGGNVLQSNCNIGVVGQGSNSSDLVFRTSTGTSPTPLTRLTLDGTTGLATFNNGIAFSQTNTSATGATDTGTTLDHYEEGTWTPTATGGGSIAGTSIAYTGFYTRIGNLVTVWFTITAAAQDLVIASYVGLAGLPFTVVTSGTGWYSTEDVDAERGGEMKAAGTVLYLGPGGSGSATNSIAGSVTYRV